MVRRVLIAVALACGLVLLVARVSGDRDSAQAPARAAAAAAPAGAEPQIHAGPTGRRRLSGPWVERTDVSAPTPALTQGRFGGRRVRVPHAPNAPVVTGAGGERSFAGAVAWYRTTFDLAAGGDHAIRFESVNHRARVFLDGREVARHTGAYLPFEARARLAPGRHTLVVRADWRDPEAMQAAGWHRTWFNFGGITREVTVRRLGASELDAPGVTTRLRGRGARATVTVRVRNRAAARAIRVSGRLGGARLAFPPVRLERGAAAWVSATAPVPRGALWSPGRPRLHALRLEVPRESGHVTRVGLREVRTAGRQLLLNGRPLALRGASIHEDAAGRGEALTPADMDGIVARLRRVGATATRAQHALHPALLERLDRAGILVWQGIGPVDQPGRWTARTPARLALAVRRARLSVLQLRAHPSVLTWSLQNEVKRNGRAGQRAYLRRAAAEAHALDPGRPVAVDVWGKFLPERGGAAYAGVDVVGATNYEGWYANLGAPGAEGRIRAWVARLRRAFPGKPLVVTEFGAEANARNPAAAPGGLAFQRDLLLRHVRVYEADRALSGMLVWALKDFALRPSFYGGSVGARRRGIELTRGINEKGLFTREGAPKPAAAAIARAFR